LLDADFADFDCLGVFFIVNIGCSRIYL